MKNKARNAGFTFIEMMLALMVLVVAVGGLVAASTSAFNLHTTAKEQMLAKEAAVQALETMRSYALDNFSSTFQKFNGTTADDPGTWTEDGYTIGLTTGTVQTVSSSELTGGEFSNGEYIEGVDYTMSSKGRMVFSVPSLQEVDPNATVSIDLPGDGFALYEYMVPTVFGGPMDMDGDGTIGFADVAGSYKVLPVTVMVQWVSRGGRQNIVLYHSLLADRR